MAEKIEHQGIVQSVGSGGVQVLIVQNDACSACAAGSTCMAADRKEKIIDAQPLNDMQVGDEVRVTIERRLGFKAVLLAFVIPFAIVITIVALLSEFSSLNDGIVGTIALIAMIPYYIVIALMKEKIKKQFSFYAEKL